MRKASAWKTLVKLFIALLVIAGIVYLGFALYGKSDATGEEDPVQIAFYDGEAGSVFTLENDQLLFEMDGDTTQFVVSNKADGSQWRSVPEGADRDPLALAGSKNLLQSTLALTYSTTNGVRTLYDSFEYAIKNQIYTILQEDDSIRVNYTLGKIARVHIIPEVISHERMNAYLEKMSKSEGRKIKDSYQSRDPAKLKEDQLKELTEQYPLLTEGPIYVLRNNVKDFLKEEFQELFAGAGYTFEDYTNDQAGTKQAMGTQNAVFNVSVVYRLEGPDLVVEVPLDSIRYAKDLPPIRLNLLPNFGAGGMEDTGYVLLPEGGGGIMRFNNGKTAQNAYFANVYGWDYASQRDAVVHETGVRLPVFGLSRNGSSFLCMMEGQASNAAISADVSGKGNSYNTASVTYNLLHYDAFNVTDRTTETIYMFEQSLPQGKIAQRYRFLASDDPFTLSSAYRDYLKAAYPEFTQATEPGLPLSIEILGAIDKVQQKGGLPVSVPVKLTAYDEAARMVEEVTAAPNLRTHVRLSGWMNGGIQQTLLKNIKLVNQLGSQADFEQMVKDVEGTGAKLYLGGLTSYALDSGIAEGFLPLRDAARFTTREQAKLFNYSWIWYGALDLEQAHYLLKPSLSARMMDNLMDSAKLYGVSGMAFEDVGSLLSADYNPKDKVDRDQVAQMQTERLAAYKEQGMGSIIRGGNLYLLPQVDLVTDMDLRGVRYFVMDETYPFVQIALHGLVDYTGQPLNLTGDWEEELLLSAQRGAGLSFVFMQEDPRVLHESNYSQYHGASYAPWADRAKDIISAYAGQLGHTFNQQITGFERLNPSLSVTTYEDGTRVAVNSDQDDQQVFGQTVPGRSYAVLTNGGGQ